MYLRYIMHIIYIYIYTQSHHRDSEIHPKMRFRCIIILLLLYAYKTCTRRLRIEICTGAYGDDDNMIIFNAGKWGKNLVNESDVSVGIVLKFSVYLTYEYIIFGARSGERKI